MNQFHNESFVTKKRMNFTFINVFIRVLIINMLKVKKNVRFLI
ncbi:hypothetical protein [Bacillus weihaiensis]|nr:hypothetical protein [Bacillus weihaiensis]